MDLKECTRCGNKATEQLRVVNERKGMRADKVSNQAGWSVVEDENDIKCGKCNYSFTIRCQNVYGGANGKERVVTFVHITTEDGQTEGWLGNF